MEEFNVENSVYFKEIETMPIYIKGSTKYNSIFETSETEKLMEIYSRNTDIYNGTVIRLDNIDFGQKPFVFYVSKIKYFDLITSNILNHTPEKWIEKCLNEEEIEFCNDKFNKIKQFLDRHNNIEDIINNNHISNVIAVSVLIKDKNGNFGLTKRSSKLNISTSFFSTTVTGDVDEEDFSSDDPLLHCAKKEVLEELGIEVTNVKLRGLAISKTKLQPVILFDAYIDEEWEQLIEKMRQSKDYDFEIEKFLIVSKNDIPKVLTNGTFTDATRCHICLNYKEGKETL